jgi:hypothetical protein
MATERIVPMGFAIPCPAISGAEPWILVLSLGSQRGTAGQGGSLRFVDTSDWLCGVRGTCQGCGRQETERTGDDG